MKTYTEYDNECMIYLALQIIKYLNLDDKWLFIDIYYNKIKEVYNDYKNYDNENVSLLDSINNYIVNNKDKILDKIEKAFEGVF